jgi:shikimate dehydrogenase
MIKKLAVLGQNDIEKYSLSPLLHSDFFEKTKIEGEYKAIPVLPENLWEKLKELQKEGYVGVNLTIPHKINVLQHLTEIDETAKIIGAVNTILFKPNGDIAGFNTDCFGFMENLNIKINDWKNNNKAIVFGAGGASRATIYGLKKDGIDDIYICNRTFDKATELAKEFDCKAIEWEDRQESLKDRNLLINTTSAGMNKNKALDIDLIDIRSDAIIYDIVYSPLETPLLKQAKNLRLRIVDGLGMLIYQGAKAFEIWFDIYPKVDRVLISKVKTELLSRE